MPESRFVVELPLRDPSSGVERIMLKRLETARFAYNQFVTELRRRHGLMRESTEYRRLISEIRSSKYGKGPSNPVKVSFQNSKERYEAWNVLRERFQLHGAYCLHEHVKKVDKILKSRTGENGLPVTLLHELAATAWHLYVPFLFRKRRWLPRCRSAREPVTIISSRSSEKNIGPLQFSDNGISWSNGRSLRKDRVVVTLPALIDKADAVIQHALAKGEDGQPLHPIRQVRIGYRVIRGKRRWFTQLVLEGEAYKKPWAFQDSGTVGVDMGSKHGAVVAVSAGYAENHLLNSKVAEALQKGRTEERRRARAQDRSKRAMNPDAFDEKGKNIRGKRASNRSKRYLLLSAERQEEQRVLKESKRQQRNALANRIVTLGASVHMEKISHRQWQRSGMGRSMLASTPAALTTAIQHACEKYGREFVEINTRNAKLSQLCHECGKYTKKIPSGPIASRISACDCGRVPIQRDLYSAFLASVCNTYGKVDRDRARKLFPEFLASLRDARETPDMCRAERYGQG